MPSYGWERVSRRSPSLKPAPVLKPACICWLFLAIYCWVITWRPCIVSAGAVGPYQKYAIQRSRLLFCKQARIRAGIRLIVHMFIRGEALIIAFTIHVCLGDPRGRLYSHFTRTCDRYV